MTNSKVIFFSSLYFPVKEPFSKITNEQMTQEVNETIVQMMDKWLLLVGFSMVIERALA